MWPPTALLLMVFMAVVGIDPDKASVEHAGNTGLGCAGGSVWTRNPTTGMAHVVVDDTDCDRIRDKSVLPIIQASQQRSPSSWDFAMEAVAFGEGEDADVETSAEQLLPACPPPDPPTGFQFDHLEGLHSEVSYKRIPTGKVSVESARQLRHVVELTPKSVDVLLDLASKWQTHGRDDLALDCYRTSLVENPNSTRILAPLANLLLRQGFFDDAIEILRSVCQNDPQNYIGYFGLGNALHQKGGQLEEATDLLRMAFRLRPNSPEVQRIVDEVTAKHSTKLPIFEFEDIVRYRNLGTVLLISVCFAITSVAVTHYIGASRPVNVTSGSAKRKASSSHSKPAKEGRMRRSATKRRK